MPNPESGTMLSRPPPTEKSAENQPFFVTQKNPNDRGTRVALTSGSYSLNDSLGFVLTQRLTRVHTHSTPHSGLYSLNASLGFILTQRLTRVHTNSGSYSLSVSLRFIHTECLTRVCTHSTPHVLNQRLTQVHTQSTPHSGSYSLNASQITDHDSLNRKVSATASSTVSLSGYLYNQKKISVEKI